MDKSTPPPWLYVGGRVATFECVSPHPRARVRTVSKIGKRDVVLEDGSRFNLARLAWHPANSWGSAVYLRPLTDSHVVKALRRQRRQRIVRAAEAKLADWLESGDSDHLQAAIDKLVTGLSQDDED